MHTFDLILDCTANRVVRAFLERARRTRLDPLAATWPRPEMIGHQATRGIAALFTARGHRRRRRCAAPHRADRPHRSHRCPRRLVEDFFPTQPRTELFQPEPGCSDATFTGSAADVTAFAGQP